jgi:Rps23 Pro-64 3,4-dihydroxylase Tpa1-like proline 4-hydroxylase
MDGPHLLALAPDLDVPALAAAYARDRRVQVRGALTEASARLIHRLLAEATPWGMAWQAAERGPERIRAEAMGAMPVAERQARSQATVAAMRGQGYAFAYSSYPLVEAYLEKWAPGGPHDALLEYINGPPVLDLVRAITGVPELIKADAQATLYAPHHFLAVHNDANSGAGRRVAYVLNLCSEDWRPDWGGYLNFYDDDGDVIAGYRPRFNALNLFAVPQRHNVGFVPPFAPLARFAITGWFRDR